ncbi:hypothetical protein [Ferrimicrobium sp.]|uniref:hypothetical protein n=1 Tax=Ferrimicrobium sp. TaxID=2926050 RepID=UPI0026230D4C|nr:hypothetical protein [Ferrimicrobium sp.]
MKLLTIRSKKRSLLRFGTTLALVLGSGAYGSMVLSMSTQDIMTADSVGSSQVLYASVDPLSANESCTSSPDACSLSTALSDVTNRTNTTIYLITQGSGAVPQSEQQGYAPSSNDYNGPFTLDIPSNDTVTIENYNSNSPVLNGDYNNTVLTVQGSGTLNLSGVTITGGVASAGVNVSNGNGGNGGNGGGISTSASLSITNSTISGNSAGAGGNSNAGNAGNAGNGGGISTSASLTITNSTISGSSAGAGGGSPEGGPGGNGGNGGGISSTATLTITNSTISANNAGTGGSPEGGSNGGNGGNGGGISASASLTITNSTISANNAGTGGSSKGGTAGTAGNGGGIFSSSSTTLTGDLLASPGVSPTGGECALSGTFTDGGYNFSDDKSCGFTNSTSNSGLTDLDTYIASSLASSGWPTAMLVFSPPSGSLAASIPIASCPPVDQRGYVPASGAVTCNAGAYQANYVEPQIRFASVPPTEPQVGQTYTPSATATSDLPVSFLSSGCLINSSNVVTFTTPGTCEIVASQSGGFSGGYYYAPASQVVESIDVAPAPTPITPTQPTTPIAPHHLTLPEIPSTSPTTQSPTPFGLITANGGIFTHEVTSFASKTGSGASDIVGGAASGTNGYWLVTKSGTVESFGTAHSYGSVTHPVGSVIGMAATPDDQGYWVVTNAGVIYNFGDAMRFVGVSIYGITGLTGTHPLAAPIVGLSPTPDGKGLYLVAADGGVFNFGDAKFLGNTYTLGITGLTGTHPLAAPIVGMTLTPDGNGYLLIAADGGVFNFGDAKFLGNTYTLGITGLTGTHPLNAPIVGGTYVPGSQAGYYLFGADGGVFNFGTAPFEGSNANTHLGAPVIGGITL